MRPLLTLVLALMSCQPVSPARPATPSAPVLLVANTSGVSVVALNGEVLSHHSFRPVVTPMTATVHVSGPRGGRVGVTTFVQGPGSHLAQTSLVLDATGAVLFDETRGDWCGPVVIGDDGDFVSCGQWHARDGSIHPLGDAQVLAAPLGGGVVPVALNGACGFWKEGVFTPWQHARCASVARLGEAVVFLSVSEAGRRFVKASTEGEVSCGHEFTDARTVILEVNEVTGTALVGPAAFGTVQADLRALSLVTKALEVVPLSLDQVSSPFAAGDTWPHLGDDGRLSLGQRNATAAGLFVSADGHDWARLGQGLVDVVGVTSLNRAGTTVIVGAGGEQTFQPGYEATVRGASVQVVTADDPWLVLTPAQLDPSRPIPLSSDGRRLAYWHEGTLMLFDVHDGRLTPVPAVTDTASTLTWLSAE